MLNADGVVVAKMDRGIGVHGGLESAVVALMKTAVPAPSSPETVQPVVAPAAARFDGAWNIVLSCPATGGAKGYSHRFRGAVEGSRLRAAYGSEGEPGWQSLQGEIADDGSAVFSLDGLVGSPDHALGGAARGTPFSAKVRAQFDRSAGTGQRPGGRECEFRFAWVG